MVRYSCTEDKGRDQRRCLGIVVLTIMVVIRGGG